MTDKLTTKRTASDSDSDSEDDAQMRQFMEAADTTLLTNAMFQADTKEGKTEPIKEAPPARSERYLEEQDAPAGDLQITKEMQTHIWSRLSRIIQSQIEFEEKPKHKKKAEEKEEQGGVRLVSNADCYLIADLVVEGPAGPTRKPAIKRRVVDEDETEVSMSVFQAVAVSGESVLEGKDVLSWAEKKERKNKLFQYRSSGGKLLAIEPTNEFTKRRRQNNWNESKIARKKKNKS